MTVSLAALTAIACLGIGVCGYIIGRLHARQARDNARPGLITDKLPIDWEWPIPPRPYDHAAEKQFADAMDKAAGQ